MFQYMETLTNIPGIVVLNHKYYDAIIQLLYEALCAKYTIIWSFSK